jgi:hypothetical protein
MRRKVQNAFEAVVDKLQHGPDPTLDMGAWWQEMKKLDSSLNLDALQPPCDLPQFMRDMEKQGVVRWSVRSGDGLLPYPLPSFDMFEGAGGSRGKGGGPAGGKGKGGAGRGGYAEQLQQQGAPGQQGQQGQQGYDRRGVYGFNEAPPSPGAGGYRDGRAGENAYNSFGQQQGGSPRQGQGGPPQGFGAPQQQGFGGAPQQRGAPQAMGRDLRVATSGPAPMGRDGFGRGVPQGQPQPGPGAASGQWRR